MNPGDAPAGWTSRLVDVDGIKVYVRTSTPDSSTSTPDSAPESRATPIVHVHGFAISGSYLMPTAQLLVGHGQNLVPDLPGYGRSDRLQHPLGIPELADSLALVLDAMEIQRAVLVGNSMGTAVTTSMAARHPDRVDRVVLVSPAGGTHNQPLRRAIAQLAVAGVREPPRLARIALPDYVRFGPLNSMRLFEQLSRYPTLERLLALPMPALVVLGDRDPLMVPRQRVMEIGRMVPPQVSVVLIEGGSHALNFSHPGELANVITLWLRDQPIVDDPDQPGLTHVLAIPRD